ncbi:MAG: biotin--[Lachnospiraceae bacterium]|nr:biotin--[acetyl-CoA-carboxylase] ligase [Lachnospiraceae bacterium]
MSVRDDLLRALWARRGEFVSGEQLGEEIGVSRASVWKAARKLQEEGYALEAVTRRGYRLLDQPDVLTQKAVASLLPKKCGAVVHVLQDVDSTNTYARRLLSDMGESFPEKLLVAADHQVGGRGRRGRSFFSPPGCGLYLTLVSRHRREAREALLSTMAAAVAVCRVIRKYSDAEPRIKWVNDIWIGEKKVCGILTEAVSDLESLHVEALIVGIGINVRTPEGGFPEEIREVAGAVDSFRVPRARIAAEIAEELFRMFDDLHSDDIFEAYRADSFILGREITWEEGDQTFCGKVLDMNRQGYLTVQTDAGQKILTAGEVSVRPIRAQ